MLAVDQVRFAVHDAKRENSRHNAAVCAQACSQCPDLFIGFNLALEWSRLPFANYRLGQLDRVGRRMRLTRWLHSSLHYWATVNGSPHEGHVTDVNTCLGLLARLTLDCFLPRASCLPPAMRSATTLSRASEGSLEIFSASLTAILLVWTASNTSGAAARTAAARATERADTPTMRASRSVHSPSSESSCQLAGTFSSPFFGRPVRFARVSSWSLSLRRAPMHARSDGSRFRR